MSRPFLTVVEPPAAVAGDLPRMDVTAFASFAAAGPFGVPVCVESPEAFTAVFGDSVALRGGPGRLADAVRAYFGQGGRRAWIVRCGDAGVAPTRFPLPGVLALPTATPGEDDDGLRPATLAARSPGTFADDQRLAVQVRRTRIEVRPVNRRVRVEAADGDVGPGRLVELPVLRAGIAARRFAVLGLPFSGTFELRSPLTVTDAPALESALRGTVGARPARMTRDATGLARVTVELPVGAPAPATIGALVRFDPEPVRPPLPARKLRLPEPTTWVLVDDLSAPSPGAGVAALELSGRAVHVDRDPAGDLQPGVGAVLELSLGGRSLGDGTEWRLDTLGCTPSSPGWAGDIPSDAERYAGADGPVTPATAPVCGTGLTDVAALVPILPTPHESAPITTAAVAAPGEGAAGEGEPGEVPAGEDEPGEDPAGETAAPGDEDAAAPRDAAARNGLTGGVADALLGGEARLGAMSVFGLESLVGARDRGDVDAPPLPGVLAVVDAAEATLLAVPDAVVGDPVASAEPDEVPVRLPALAADAVAAGFGSCAAAPEVPALADAERRVGGVALSWVVLGAAEYEVGRFAEADALAPAAILYRGPAEVTGSGITPAGEPAPVFGVTVAPGARGWARVRALDATGRAGGWSIGVPLPLPARGAVQAAQDATADDLRTVHAALLRIAALRGDALALLSVPAGWTLAAAHEHAARLRARVGEQERHVLGFGTLAHPWPLVPAPAPEVVTAVPADAALAGQLAAMAIARGAWIAVSDRPLRDAVDTATDRAPRAADLGVAPLAGPLVHYVAGPRGVVADGQDTLALDADARPVNVRRLLALLRRAALERGRATVFEPNGPVLWRALHRDLEGLLAQLHERGAFRPERAVEAYRVDVFPGDGHGDDGRCICELRVAPSLPLRFLTVRLELSAGAS